MRFWIERDTTVFPVSEKLRFDAGWRLLGTGNHFLNEDFKPFAHEILPFRFNFTLSSNDEVQAYFAIEVLNHRKLEGFDKDVLTVETWANREDLPERWRDKEVDHVQPSE